MDPFSSLAAIASKLLQGGPHCVAGLETPGLVRVHICEHVSDGTVLRLRDVLGESYVPAHISVSVTCAPRPKVLALINKIFVSVQISLPAEACGSCGLREVRDRRCAFCGARA